MAIPDAAREEFTVEHSRIKVGYFATKDMFIDPRYQRTHKERRITEMAENWDEGLAGCLELSARVDEHGNVVKYAVIDGGGRLTAAREATARKLQNVEFLYSKATWGYTPEMEAKLFSSMNFKRTAVHVVERFKADAYAGTEPAPTIMRALNGAGMRVDYAAGEQTIGAVKALEQVHLWGALPFTLRVITEAWLTYPEARAANAILAVGSFDKCFREYGYDEEHLLAVLADVSPGSLVTQAKTNVKSGLTANRSYWSEVARLITNRYNRGLKTVAAGKLPDYQRPDLPRSEQTLTKGDRGSGRRERQARRMRRDPQATVEKQALRTLEKARAQLAK